MLLNTTHLYSKSTKTGWWKKAIKYSTFCYTTDILLTSVLLLLLQAIEQEPGWQTLILIEIESRCGTKKVHQRVGLRKLSTQNKPSLVVKHKQVFKIPSIISVLISCLKRMKSLNCLNTFVLCCWAKSKL